MLRFSNRIWKCFANRLWNNNEWVKKPKTEKSVLNVSSRRSALADRNRIYAFDVHTGAILKQGEGLRPVEYHSYRILAFL